MSDDLTSNYYQVLGLAPSASVQQIRRAYRDLSKLYHPDTTKLATAIATAKFQQLNEAYGTLSSPEKRIVYDLKIGYSRFSVIQAPADLNVSKSRQSRSSAYLEPIDRPLSAGEVFALFILGITFLGCLLLVIAIGLTRGESAFQPLTATSNSSSEVMELVNQADLDPGNLDPDQPLGHQGLSLTHSISPTITPAIAPPLQPDGKPDGQSNEGQPDGKPDGQPPLPLSLSPSTSPTP